jgi:hypothetical protein
MIGFFSSMSTKLVLKSFMTVKGLVYIKQFFFVFYIFDFTLSIVVKY